MNLAKHKRSAAIKELSQERSQNWLTILIRQGELQFPSDASAGTYQKR
jgi:hypothetical protein